MPAGGRLSPYGKAQLRQALPFRQHKASEPPATCQLQAVTIAHYPLRRHVAGPVALVAPDEGGGDVVKRWPVNLRRRRRWFSSGCPGLPDCERMLQDERARRRGSTNSPQAKPSLAVGPPNLQSTRSVSSEARLQRRAWPRERRETTYSERIRGDARPAGASRGEPCVPCTPCDPRCAPQFGAHRESPVPTPGPVHPKRTYYFRAAEKR
jgi:hypothetical protein